MIHVDTNLLIAAMDPSHLHHAEARHALSIGQPAGTSAVAWTELRSRPVPPVLLKALSAILGPRIVPFARDEAELAAVLFQATGVKRAQQLDSMIAATAILARAQLATVNTGDFQPFVAHGLKLFPLRQHPAA